MSTSKGSSFLIRRKYILNKETVIPVDAILFVLYTTLEKHANLQRDITCFGKKNQQTKY